MPRLTDKQKRFVEEYLVDLNATQAAIRAGYSAKNADKIGHELLGKTRVSEAIQEAMDSRSARTEITQDMILRELARVAFSNGTDFARVVSRETPTTIVDEEGNPQQVMGTVQSVRILDTDTVDPEKRAAIASIKEGKYGIEVSSYDKVKALELLGKHLGMFDAKATQNKGRENNLLDRLLGGTEEEMNADDLPEV